ncbi:hypothetical protein THAOC_29422, partial [Thalassiosira oceanica]
RGYIADRPERSHQLGLQLTPPRTSDAAFEVRGRQRRRRERRLTPLHPTTDRGGLSHQEPRPEMFSNHLCQAPALRTPQCRETVSSSGHFSRPRKTCGSADSRAGPEPNNTNNNNADGDSAEPPGPERSGGQATKTGKGRRVDGASLGVAGSKRPERLNPSELAGAMATKALALDTCVVAKGEEIYNQSFDAFFDEDLSTELAARRTKPCYFGAGDCQGTCLHASKKKNPSSLLSTRIRRGES